MSSLEHGVLRIRDNVRICVAEMVLDNTGRPWMDRRGRPRWRVREQQCGNAVVTRGLDNVVKYVVGTDGPAGDPPTHFAVGTGNTPPVHGNFELESEVFRDMLSGRTHDGSVLAFTYILGTGDANGNTLAEAGLFNDSSGGDLWARVAFATPFAKNALVQVSFTWYIEIDTPGVDT